MPWKRPFILGWLSVRSFTLFPFCRMPCPKGCWIWRHQMPSVHPFDLHTILQFVCTPIGQSCSTPENGSILGILSNAGIQLHTHARTDTHTQFAYQTHLSLWPEDQYGIFVNQEDWVLTKSTVTVYSCCLQHTHTQQWGNDECWL